MKDIYQTNGIASTVNFEHIKKVYQVFIFIPEWEASQSNSSEHRIDTRPEGTLLCVLAEGKRPKFFYVL